MMIGKQLRLLCSILSIDLVLEREEELFPCFDSVQDSPLMQSPQLRSRLREGLGEKPVYLVEGDYGEFFASMKVGEGILYMGPMLSARLRPYTSRAFYASYEISAEQARVLPAFSPAQIRDRVLHVFYVVQNPALFEDSGLDQMESSEEGSLGGSEGDGGEWIFQEILLQAEQVKKEQTSFVLKEEEEDDDQVFRHSYYEEKLLMEAVKEGRQQDAIRLVEGMDRDEGRLSTEDLHHWKNLSIVGISLCARAAIEGGVAPEVAYRLSGYYIRKCDLALQVPACLQYRNAAISELAQRAGRAHEEPRGSGYVERCKDYIRKHYREKILLEEMAQSLGVSAGHLSKLFKKETGKNLQEYINEERVYRASNLLLYSDLSLSEIAQYVHFPNQSYFGQVFKKVKGMTPRLFRERYRTPEFTPE